MQPHIELLLKERFKDFIIVVDDLWVECRLLRCLNRFSLRLIDYIRASTFTVCWGHELGYLILFLIIRFLLLLVRKLDRFWYRWINCELYSHLVIVREDGHRLLIADDEIEKCCD